MGEPAAARSSVADGAAPWIAAALLFVMVVRHRYPAMLDLPCHEEVVAAMRHFGDARFYPHGLLRWNPAHPNQLFYFLAWALSFVVPVDVACRMVVAASVAAVPLGAARLAAHLGVARAQALFAAPVALGFCFYFGFVGNLLSLGMLLATLPSLDRLARTPDARGAAVATGVLLLLFLAHDSALIAGGLAVTVLSLGRPLFERATVWRIAPPAIAATAAIIEEFFTVQHNGPNLRALPVVIDLGFYQKLSGLPKALLGLHGAGAVGPAFWAIASGLALLLGQWAVALGPRIGAESPRDLYDEHRFVALGLVLLVAYFEVPFSFAGAMWLHARFLAPAVMVLGVALGPRLPARAWWPSRWIAVGALALVVHMVEPELSATAQVYSDLDVLLPRIAPASAIAAIDLIGGPFDGHVFTVAGAAARAVSERGGRMAACFVEASPIPPVVVAPEHRWEDSLLRLSRDTLSLEPGRDLLRFRYALAWTLPEQAPALVGAMSPEARLVGRSGGWLLFESTLEVQPLMSDEPPGERGETVRDRLARRADR